MTYTIVVPTSSWTPTRENLNVALGDMIAAFQAAVPGVVRAWWSEIPPSFTAESPTVWLGDITESITHDAGLRVTTYTGTLEYVDTATDNEEANTRANAFADYFRELFTANARVLGAGVLQQTGLREEPATDGPLNAFMHLVLEWTYIVQEGRN